MTSPASRRSAASIEDAYGSSTWSRIASKRPCSWPATGVSGVVEVQRGAVVDQPEAVVPPEEVRVLRRAIDVRHERVEPDDVGGEVGIGGGAGGRAERQRARQEVDAEVEPVAREQQVLDLGVGLGAADRGVELDQRRAPAPEARAPARALPRRSRRRAPSAPWPAPRNLRTYSPSSSASTSAGSDPPSRSGVTYLVAVTVRIRASVATWRPQGSGVRRGLASGEAGGLTPTCATGSHRGAARACGALQGVRARCATPDPGRVWRAIRPAVVARSATPLPGPG